MQVTHKKARKEKQRKENHRQKANTKMADLSPKISITILNVNSLNIPIKRLKMVIRFLKNPHAGFKKLSVNIKT